MPDVAMPDESNTSPGGGTEPTLGEGPEEGDRPAADGDGRRRGHVWYVVAAVGIAIGTIAVVVWQWHSRTQSPPRQSLTYSFTHADDPAALQRIDHAKVHGELFPAWVLSVARAKTGGTWANADAAYDRLRAAVHTDANLGAILDELRGLARQEAWAHGRRIVVLFDAWCEYLVRNGIPFEARAVVHQGGDGPSWVSARFYRRDASVPMRVGTHTVVVNFVRRVDRLNVHERYRGQVEEAGRSARVVVDRISDFALTSVWPLLRQTSPGEADLLSATERAFAPAVSAAVEAALPADAVAVLRRTALARASLARVARQISDRAACGSTFGINFVPWNGFTDDALDDLDDLAAETGEADCPEVTPDEAADARRYSRESAETPAGELLAALERLVAWTARSTAIHEARHLADDQDAQAGGVLHCPECASLAPASIVEASAFIASFADPSTGNLAVYQACSLPAGTDPDAHQAAIRFLLSMLLPDGCPRPPPNNQTVRAAALERRLFGRSDPTLFAGDPPDRCAVAR